jgi:choline-sulfatase
MSKPENNDATEQRNPEAGGSTESGDGITRGELLKGAAAVTAGVALGVPASAQARAPRRRSRRSGLGRDNLAGMNVILFLSDQERALQHFPRGWAQQNLPGFNRLQRNGLTFQNAFTNACMCSPARSTLLTGLFPAQHGVKYTLESDMPADQYPQIELSTQLPNIATVLREAGYTPVYKGKYHCVKAANGGTNWVPSDVNQYGWTRWDPPDAGANQDIPEEGGGFYNHDGRYINGQGEVEEGGEGAIQFLTSAAAQTQPFFMVISVVNPHDVLFYPGVYEDAGYDDSWLEGNIKLPPTVNENLRTKPDVQEQFLRIFNLAGNPRTRRQKLNYINFYGNLMRSTDGYLVKVLDTLARTGLRDNTIVVRTADHGEMGLAHGGLRQKNFNFYEETIRVPLIYSNPRLWPRPRTSNALVSHVDFLPTLASLFNVPASARAPWQGVDYSNVILRPNSRAPQDYTVFTYDDWQSGQTTPLYPQPPNHIASIREARYKLARYYDTEGRVPDQWEMYDLEADPYERNNLARPGYRRTPEQEREYRRLRQKLAEVEATRLRPRPDTPQSPIVQPLRPLPQGLSA